MSRIQQAVFNYFNYYRGGRGDLQRLPMLTQKTGRQPTESPTAPLRVSRRKHRKDSTYCIVPLSPLCSPHTFRSSLLPQENMGGARRRDAVGDHGAGNMEERFAFCVMQYVHFFILVKCLFETVLLLLLAVCLSTAHPNIFTLHTALPWVVSNKPAKCEVNWINGCRENRIRHTHALTHTHTHTPLD